MMCVMIVEGGDGKQKLQPKRRTNIIGLVVNATGYPGGNERSFSVYCPQ